MSYVGAGVTAACGCVDVGVRVDAGVHVDAGVRVDAWWVSTQPRVCEVVATRALKHGRRAWRRAWREGALTWARDIG